MRRQYILAQVVAVAALFTAAAAVGFSLAGAYLSGFLDRAYWPF